MKTRLPRFVVFVAVLLLVLSVIGIAEYIQYLEAAQLPANNSYTSDITPMINFSYTSDTVGFLNCTLIINNGSGYRDYGKNTSVENNTITYITANGSVAEGIRFWYVNCTNITNAVFNASTLFYLTIDTLAPATANTSFPTNKSNSTNNSPELRFHFADGGAPIINYTIYVDGVPNGTGYATNDTLSVRALTGLQEGTKTIIITATDLAFNVLNSSSRVYTLDENSPVSNITYPADNITSISDSTPYVTIQGRDGIDTILNYSVYVNGVINATGTVVNGTATNVTLGTFDEGYYSVIVQQVDEFNSHKANSSTANVSLDFTAPATVNTSNPTNLSNTSNITPELRFQFTDSWAATLNYTIYLNGVPNGTGYVNNDTLGARKMSGLQEGIQTVIITAADPAGNALNSSSRVFYVDENNPVVNITYPADNITSTADSTPYITIKVNDGMDTILNYSVYVNGVINATGTVVNGTATNVTLGTFGEGYYSIIAEGRDDMAGHVANSTTRNVTVDLGTPNVTLVTPADGGSDTDGNVTFNFTLHDSIDFNLSYTLIINGTRNATGVATGNDTWFTVTLAWLQNAMFNWTVEATDDAGTAANGSFYTFSEGDSTGPTTAPIVNYSFVNDSDQDGNVEILWAADTNAQSYRIYRSTSVITSITDELANVTGLFFEDNTSRNGTLYYYVVTSIDQSGNENQSNFSFGNANATAYDAVNPKTTVAFDGINHTDGSILLNWTVISTDLNGSAELNLTYLLYKWTNTVSLNTSNLTQRVYNTTLLVYNDTDIVTGVNYSYGLFAIDDGLNTNLTNYTDVNTVNLVAQPCMSAYDDWSDYSSCSGGEKTRTRSRTCYGGDETTETETASCGGGNIGSGGGSPRGGDDSGSSSTTFTFGSIQAGTPQTLTVSGTDLGVTEITLEVSQAVTNAKVTVKKLSAQPSDTSGSAGSSVYKYLQINVENIPVGAFSGVIPIKFKVDKSWLVSNGINEGDVVLRRYVSGQWQELPTRRISSDSSFALYEAETPGFSYFAIAGKSVAATPTIAPVDQPDTGDADDGVAPSATPVSGENVEPSLPEGEDGGSSTTLIVGIILLVVIVVVVIAYVKKRK